MESQAPVAHTHTHSRNYIQQDWKKQLKYTFTHSYRRMILNASCFTFWWCSFNLTTKNTSNTTQSIASYLQCASLTKLAYILHVLTSIWSLQCNCNSPQLAVFSSSLPSCAPPLQLLANQQPPSADQWNELLANRHGEGRRTWHECTGVDNLKS